MVFQNKLKIIESDFIITLGPVLGLPSGAPLQHSIASAPSHRHLWSFLHFVNDSWRVCK